VADFPETTSEPVYEVVPRGKRVVRYEKVPFKPEHLLNEYEEEYGGPVWYIP
jgi:hypothetical protein